MYISGTLWATKKSITISSHPVLKSFQLEKDFVKSGHNISWFGTKRWFFFNKKSAIEKESAISLN